MSEAALTRLKIEAFKSEKYRDNEKVDSGVFEFQANPEHYSVSYSLEYNQKQPKGMSGYDPSWVKNQPKKLSFEFILDGTGAISPLSSKDEVIRGSIESQIEKFEKIVFNMNGDSHSPNYLRLSWGVLSFECRLESMTMNYKLFAPDGKPLRVLINAAFFHVTPLYKQKKKDNQRSPDVTHALTVKGDESLPMMTEKVYGSSSHYIAVAQANKLIHFRNIKAGDTIVFPPIKDQYA